jgi:hypothetical protein
MIIRLDGSWSAGVYAAGDRLHGKVLGSDTAAYGALGI